MKGKGPRKLDKPFTFIREKELKGSLELNSLSPGMRAVVQALRRKDVGKIVLRMFLPQTQMHHGGGEDDAGLLHLSEELDGKG